MIHADWAASQALRFCHGERGAIGAISIANEIDRRLVVRECLGDLARDPPRSRVRRSPHLRIGTAIVVPTEALKKWLIDEAKVEEGRIDAAVEEILEELESDK